MRRVVIVFVVQEPDFWEELFRKGLVMILIEEAIEVHE